jgi:hypothetical protein
MISIPPYFIERPALAGPEAAEAFNALFDQALVAGDLEPIDYHLEWPRWQFISHIVERHELVVHGSQNSTIKTFEPRKSNDAHPFGDRQAVYGASDGLWAMYYAILDRPAHPMTIVNSAMRFEDEDGSLSAPHYFLSISQPALEARAFKPGMLYFLPGDSFEPMPPMQVNGTKVHVLQWASLVAVKPLARIAVAPADFPLLDRIRGHDDEHVMARAKADPDGFPWLDP